jgi:branched-chain amino acid transport system ATP-binding protein
MQMLAIARALLSGPRVLLLDEPSLGLAPQVVARVYQVLRELNSQGLAMVLVEQKAVPLQRVASTVLVLQNGRLIHQSDGASLTEEMLAELYLRTPH